MATVPPQLSVAVAVPVLPGSVESLQPTAASAGQVITGAVVSATVMVWLTVADSLPQASTAFQVLVRL